MKTLMQNLGLTNTTFNKFLIISKKNIGFLLKFYHGFSKQYHIFELRNLFTTFESLKSVKFPRHTVVQNSNSKNFIRIPRHFKLHCRYSYIIVTLQLHIVKHGEFKKE